MSEFISRFKKAPVMGILRGVKVDVIKPLVETAISAGLEAIEITMNTEGAVGLICDARKAAGKRMSIGAGTVITMASLKKALDAGAEFIVMPVLVRDIVEYCRVNKIPVFPGGLTPQEIYDAWAKGATMVKVFPSGVFGPAYFKEIKGPFKEIELLACGGVTPENMQEYLSNGASAIAFGSSVFRQEWLAKRDYKSIARAISKFTRAVRGSTSRL